MTQLPETTKRLYRADGTPRPVGVIGYPVSHSRSPQFQNAAFEYYNLPHRYEKWEVAPEDLAAFLLEMKNQDFLGLNVTIPHKESVLDHLETGTPEVGDVGAANTLFLHEDQYMAGHNTDVGGFLQVLKEEGCEVAGIRAMVLGAGGAARAIIYALAKAGAIEISIANRTIERAAELCDVFAEQFPNCHIFPLPFDSAGWPPNRNPRNLIVNTTSFGLKPEDKDKPFPFTAWQLSGHHPDRMTYFFDLVYGDTPFLKQARSEKAQHMIDGTSMLVYQGALSFELWTGLPAPREVMLAAVQAPQ
ncbi:MAG: shikimate dehydrogenase [Chloroflexi bacterium]|uniref:Shikimate dehydrogenase (NADP(+)) n=1 Tax=Candidatus Chlorohelix allophototropha TaxID=3003348 RepID=A0A8T7LYG7_9CHLR|nr:shikimate dehydrogenase [Chloroflexota bacterium]WJW67838.1 shikimate dehydrogenase [Chloroflexota bacterium L227-S17]